MVATRRTSRGLPPLPKKGPSRNEGREPKAGDSAEGAYGSSSCQTSQTRTRNNNTTELNVENKHENNNHGSSLGFLATTTTKAVRNTTATAEVSDDGGSGDSSASRCKEQKTAGHFLQGIQLDGCADVLSIPDPPSPGKVPAARRYSTPVARPLRNISNASDTEDEGEGDLNKNVSSRSKDRLKRKSMPNSFRPSPADPTPSLDNGVAATPLGYSEIAEETNEQSCKRRKKRQSIILPSDLEATDANADEYTKTYATFKNDPSPPATPARETKTPSKPLTTTLYDIRHIIHEYTAIPKGERAAAASAQELCDRTEYPVRSTMPEHSNNCVGPVPVFDPSFMSRDQKLAFFAKIGPGLQQMDACKVSDAKMVAEVTQCKAQKARGGYYRYVHSVTGRPVAPEEFEERYLMMLEEVNHIRSQAWKEYFLKLREEGRAGRDVEDSSQETPQCTEYKVYAERSSPNAQHLVVDRSDEAPQDVQGPPSDDDDDSEAAGQHVLSLPSRDEESSNPVIARAERKLWNAIDEALAEYSREVVAAMAASAQQTTIQC